MPSPHPLPSPHPRSYLFVPGSRPDRFAKAFAAGADAAIVDLEDAVPAFDKGAARAALAAWLSPDHPVLIRVNGADTEWFRDDLALCGAPGVAGILLPKAEDAGAIRFIAEQSKGAAILPLIETARGFDRIRELAQSPGVQRLAFGSIDFQHDLSIEGDDAEILYFRSHIVLVSRLAGIDSPVDGVTPDIDDLDRVRAEAMRAKRLGFGAKLCIHPKQVAVVNECFRATPEEEAWARRVVHAAAAAGGAAISLDGKMIDKPVILRAEAILARVGKPPQT
jgi:citrate lyase subunit beta/citryl-CoA lyase